MKKTEIWDFFNQAKIKAVQELSFSQDQKLNLKLECDDLFRQATGYPICPAWYIEPL